MEFGKCHISRTSGIDPGRAAICFVAIDEESVTGKGMVENHATYGLSPFEVCPPALAQGIVSSHGSAKTGINHGIALLDMQFRSSADGS